MSEKTVKGWYSIELEKATKLYKTYHWLSGVLAGTVENEGYLVKPL